MGLTIERLNLGSVQIDASCLVLNNLPGRKVRVPVWAYLVLGSDEGPVLVDSGYRETDVAIMKVMGMKAVASPEFGLERELARCGLRPSDIRYIVHTHLHLDHAGNDDLFPMETTVVVNRRELEVAAGYGTLAYPPRGTKHIIDRVYTPGAAWLLDLPYSGPVEVLPGIVCELAGGHTEGSTNVLVETADGVACICGDLIYSVQEQIIRPALQLHHEYRTTGTFDVPLAQERAAVKKVMMTGRWVLPMHDQPVKVGRNGMVLGHLVGTLLPGPVAQDDTPLLAHEIDEEPEALSVDLANRWLN